jgi:hypothetical protein
MVFLFGERLFGALTYDPILFVPAYSGNFFMPFDVVVLYVAVEPRAEVVASKNINRYYKARYTVC